MAAAASVFHRVRTGSKIGAQYDQEGNLIQVTLKEHFNPFLNTVYEAFTVQLHNVIVTKYLGG